MLVFVHYRGRIIDSYQTLHDDKEKAIDYAKARVVHAHGDNATYEEFTYTVSRKPQ